MNRYHVWSNLYLEELRHTTKAKQFSGSFPQDIAELFQKPLQVLTVFENLPAFDTADNDMTHRPRSMDAGFALHEWMLALRCMNIQIQQIDIYVNLSLTSPSPPHTLSVKNFGVKLDLYIDFVGFIGFIESEATAFSLVAFAFLFWPLEPSTP